MEARLPNSLAPLSGVASRSFYKDLSVLRWNSTGSVVQFEPERFKESVKPGSIAPLKTRALQADFLLERTLPNLAVTIVGKLPIRTPDSALQFLWLNVLAARFLP